MKSTIESEKIKLTDICINLIEIKSIVLTLKNSSIKGELEYGFKPIQEVAMRFRSASDMVQRFLKSEPHVLCLVNGKRG